MFPERREMARIANEMAGLLDRQRRLVDHMGTMMELIPIGDVPVGKDEDDRDYLFSPEEG